MTVYDSPHINGIWDDEDTFKPESSQNTDSSTIVEAAEIKLDDRLEDALQEILRPSKQFELGASKPTEKALRRLAQNREAARKSRLRKKAYIQQLESQRIKLAQIEQELERARHQGLYAGRDSSLGGLPGSVNSGIAAFEMEYTHWIEDQKKHVGELRSALQSGVSDIELHMLVESGMQQYKHLFHIKKLLAKSDVLYLMSGMWKSPVERFFLWIGGFSPSCLLKILAPQLEPLTEDQVMAVYKLQNSSQQGEDALSQGFDKLRQTLATTMASDHIDSFGVPNYMSQMSKAMGELDALESFVNAAENLRETALEQMYLILTPRQAALALLVLGDYLLRLRALSSLWAARPPETE